VLHSESGVDILSKDYIRPNVPSVRIPLLCRYRVELESEVDPETGEPITLWVTKIYDPVTFLIKFYSYEIDGFEGKEAEADKS